MFGLEPIEVFAILAGITAAALLVRGLFRVDDVVEARRKDAIEISNDLGEVGLGVLQPLLNNYAVGDYSGLFGEAKRIARVMRDPAQRDAALLKLFNAQLDKRLSDPTERAEIQRRLTEAISRALPITPANGTTATVAPA